MRSDSLFAAFGAAPSLALSLLSVLYVVVSAYVYISLIHQISARAAPKRSGVDAATRSFGLPEAILAAVLTIFLLLNICASVLRRSIDFSTDHLLGNSLLQDSLVLLLVTFLQHRGFDLRLLGRL